MSTTRAGNRLARASVLDTARVAVTVAAPMLAQGIILRRRRMVELAARLDADRRAGRLLARLRARYGPGPLRLRVPRRSVALVLAPADVARVLAETPSPFTPANREKRAALAHFQPDGVLISHGALREKRRRLNEAVLDTPEPVHRLAGSLAAKVREEAQDLLAAADASGRLDWDTFTAAFWRIIRRVTLGDGARDDRELTDLLNALRARANSAFLRPEDPATRDRFFARLRTHLRRAEPDSLAGVLAATPADPETCAKGQVPHWLFAFDAAGIAAYRTLALLATHPEAAARAAADARDPESVRLRPYLRACVLDSLRLWPTTLTILRDSTAETRWEGDRLPAGTALVIVSSFFHRDEETLPYADRFAPEIWLDGEAEDAPALVPFSAGPARCPGQNLVLFVTSTLLATLLDGRAYRLDRPRLDPARPLPRTLSHFSLEFVPGPARYLTGWGPSGT